MNRVIFVAVAASVLLCGPVMAQSAKFSASWDNDPVTVKAEAWSVDDVVNYECNDAGDADGICVVAEVEMAKLHVGSQKSILVGVSSEVGIYLVTTAKGGRKDTGGVEANLSSSATAEGTVEVNLTLENEDGTSCAIAPDNSVILKSESRTLTVSGGGSDPLDLLLEDQEFWIEVGITTDSKGATHFEFLGVECEQGTYTLTATFDLTAIADASGYDASSEAVVSLTDRMITMQEVRAVKGSLVPDTN
jgi:hypothetical protein